MTKVIALTYSTIHSHLARITATIFVACLLLIFAYAFNIFSIVSRTVSLQKMESKISAINSSVNNLDSEYLRLSGQITPDNLISYGMSQGKVSEYISRLGTDIGFTGNFNHVALGSHGL